MRSGPLATAVALALLGCGGDDGPVEARVLGEHLFGSPTMSDSRFNRFSCETCHADGPEDADDGHIRSGYSLVDSAFRESYWGGYEPRLIDAVSFCLVYFMRSSPLEATDPRGRALYEHLVSISPQRPSPALPLTVVANVTSVPRGDPRRGEEVWDAACRVCHGEPHTGRGRIDELASIVPEDSAVFAEEYEVDLDLVIVEKVRHGQFFGVGGNMPLFARETLSDEDLGALIAYLVP